MRSAAQLAGVTSESVLERDWSLGKNASVLHQVPCRLQESVTCGPVCLMMAADGLLGLHGKSCSGLVELAVQKGFSKKGEMFSCAHLAELAREYFGLHAEVVSDWDELQLAKRLKQEAKTLVLVPYDCASNFEPGLFDGEKAHWAVVIGLEETPEGVSSFVCVQPKSKRIGIWSAKDLVASNKNLKSCKNKQMQDLVVPDDLSELRGKIVVLLQK